MTTMTSPATLPRTAPSPVTVTVTRRAPAGRDREVLAWLQAGVSLAERAPGFLGAGWLRPSAASEDWHVLYRFATPDDLAGWEGSPERSWWLDSGRGLVWEHSSERRTGIEGWFDQPSAYDLVLPQPPRWKQAVVIWLGFFPLSLLSALLLAPHLAALVVPLRILASTLVLTPTMTWLVLPRVTRALEWWLHGRPAPWRRAGAHALSG